AIFIKKTPRNPVSNAWSILKNASGVFKWRCYTLVILAQSIHLFYSVPLMFWQAFRFLHHAVEAFPDVFFGLSYPIVTSLITYCSAAAMMVGAALVPYLATSLESGSGLFRCFPPTQLSVPIIMAA
ncbi:hypothetical protein PFISCL1PPCAC_22197, partial [Pristionchus fissidentatus]